MPFKIVQTIERGRTVLTAIPDSWENNGILSWPSNRSKHEKLRRLQNSEPEPNWKKINCVVKRANMLSFSSAESEIDKMSNLSDTETDDRNVNNNTDKFKKLTQNFNEEATEAELQSHIVKDDIAQHDVMKKRKDVIIIQSDVIIPAVKKHTGKENVFNPKMSNGSASLNIQDDTNIPDVTKNTEMQNIVNPPQDIPAGDVNDVILIDEAMTRILSKVDSMAEDIKTIDVEYKVIQQNQQALFQNQNNILLKLIEIQTQFEEFMKHSFKPLNKEHEIKLIDNLTDFKDLENSLGNEEFVKNLKSKVEILCIKGKKRGINNAYALFDVFFTRRFLTDCSWAGGSKSEESKICFKGFTKVIDFFFSVLHESDSTLLKPDFYKFIKTILKNSQQRFHSKQARASTMRIRQKGKKVTKAASPEESLSKNPLVETDKAGPSGVTKKSVKTKEESLKDYIENNKNEESESD